MLPYIPKHTLWIWLSYGPWNKNLEFWISWGIGPGITRVLTSERASEESEETVRIKVVSVLSGHLKIISRFWLLLLPVKHQLLVWLLFWRSLEFCPFGCFKDFLSVRLWFSALFTMYVWKCISFYLWRLEFIGPFEYIDWCLSWVLKNSQILPILILFMPHSSLI